MAVEISEQGAQTLLKLSQDLSASVDEVTLACDKLESDYEDLKSCLGPHTGEIEDILSEVRQAQAGAQTSVLHVVNTLMKMAAKIREIVAKKLMSDSNP